MDEWTRGRAIARVHAWRQRRAVHPRPSPKPQGHVQVAVRPQAGQGTRGRARGQGTGCAPARRVQSALSGVSFSASGVSRPLILSGFDLTCMRTCTGDQRYARSASARGLRGEELVGLRACRATCTFQSQGAAEVQGAFSAVR